MKRAIVDKLTALAHELGTMVVAEGIETAGERDALVSIGCDLLQGYLFAKPREAVSAGGVVVQRRRSTLVAAPMPRATLTQREMVRRLLTSGKLTAAEQSAFRAIYEDMAAGKTTELTRQQQLWAERLYHWTYKLGEERVDLGKKRGNARQEEQLAAFDAMPRPKKPPGTR